MYNKERDSSLTKFKEKLIEDGHNIRCFIIRPKANNKASFLWSNFINSKVHLFFFHKELLKSNQLDILF